MLSNKNHPTPPNDFRRKRAEFIRNLSRSISIPQGNDLKPVISSDEFPHYVCSQCAISECVFSKHLGSVRVTQGAFGSVKLVAIQGIGDAQAVKIVKVTSRAMLQVAVREFETLKALCHRSVVNVFRLLLEPEGALSYMFMQYVPGLPLSDLIDASPIFTGKHHLESQARIIALQLFSALSYLQARGVLHRDINPANIIIAGDVATLVDFETACEAGLATGLVGTKPYQAPEMWDSQSYDCRVDVWSACAVLLRMLRSSDLCKLSDACRSFLSWCGQPNPQQRCWASEALTHPWLQ